MTGDRIVIDASAVAAVLFNEPEGHYVLERAGSAPLHAPSLLSYELANICVKKVRRHRDAAVDLLESLAEFDDLSITLVDVDHQAVTVLAIESGLTAYDASYLWLARKLGAELITLDRQLARAAGH